MSSKVDLVTMIGFGTIIGFYSIYKKINQIKYELQHKIENNSSSLISSSSSSSSIIESDSNLLLTNWMEDLIQVHAATCNDRELSSKSIFYSSF